MPYRHAHWWVLLVIAVILGGFWPSYWSTITTSRWQFHLHGLIASVWVLMVFFQSWSVHHKKLPLHRATGQASLYLFPLLIGGLFAIIDVTAKKFAGGDVAANPVTMMHGRAFLTGMLVAAAAYVTLYYRALKYRRKVWPHAGYLLGTPIILFESPFSRLLDILGVPAFAIRGPEDFDKLMPSILWADAVALVFCLAVYLRVGERAKPFLVTAGFVAAQMVVMATSDRIEALGGIVRWMGAMPSAGLVAIGVAVGAATSWLGWQAGKSASKAPVGAVAA